MVAHLFSLLVPAMGAPAAGIVVGLATVAAILGRTLVGWLMPSDADRRIVASLNYAIQIAGCAAFVVAGGANIPLLVLGVILFGVGIGNVTSLPPLIAQAEFAPDDVPRVVALATSIAQAIYAFGPAAFGLLRDVTSGGESTGAAPALFVAATIIQVLAIAAYLLGRGAHSRR